MRLARTTGTLLLLAILAGGFLTFRLIRPYQGFQGETFVDIPRGASTATMAGMLAGPAWCAAAGTSCWRAW